jgi:hypothetical protein
MRTEAMEFYGPTDLNFNMWQERLFNFVLRNLVLKVFVTQQIVIHPPLQSDLHDVQEKGKTTSTPKKVCIHS